MADLFADRLEGSLAQLAKGQAADYDREAHQGFDGKIDVPPARRFVGFDAYRKRDRQRRKPGDSGHAAAFSAAALRVRRRAGTHVFMEKPLAVDAPGSAAS